MAVRTIQKGTGGTEYDAQGNVVGEFRIEIDYDDTTLDILVARAINTTSKNGGVTVVRNADGREYGPFVIPPHTTVERNVTTNAQNRLRATIDAQGRLDGVDVNIAWPA